MAQPPTTHQGHPWRATVAPEHLHRLRAGLRPQRLEQRLLHGGREGTSCRRRQALQRGAGGVLTVAGQVLGGGFMEVSGWLIGWLISGLIGYDGLWWMI